METNAGFILVPGLGMWMMRGEEKCAPGHVSHLISAAGPRSRGRRLRGKILCAARPGCTHHPEADLRAALLVLLHDLKLQRERVPRSPAPGSHRSTLSAVQVYGTQCVPPDRCCHGSPQTRPSTPLLSSQGT